MRPPNFTSIAWASALSLIGTWPVATAKASPPVNDFVAKVRESIHRERIKLSPHEFQRGGVLVGGADRPFSELGSPSSMSYPVNTVCLLEADTQGLSRPRRTQLLNLCQREILDSVRRQLDLLDNGDLSKDELDQKLRDEQDKAVKAFTDAAAKLGFRPYSKAGPKRWTVKFVTQPAGAKIYIMNAGDYDVYRWCKQNGMKQKTPDWVPVFETETFGHRCLYYICAKWDNGEKSSSVLYIFDRNETITLTPAVTAAPATAR